MKPVLRMLVVGLLAGCAGADRLYPVSGVVTLNGKPVAAASVTFLPEGQGGEPAVATTDPKGRFELDTGIRGAGAREGSYTVLISKTNMPEPGPQDRGEIMDLQVIPRQLLPIKYSIPTQTPFKNIEVPAGGKTDFEINLEGRPGH